MLIYIQRKDVIIRGDECRDPNIILLIRIRSHFQCFSKLFSQLVYFPRSPPVGVITQEFCLPLSSPGGSQEGNIAYSCQQVKCLYSQCLMSAVA